MPDCCVYYRRNIVEHCVCFYVAEALLLMVQKDRSFHMTSLIVRLILYNVEDASVFTSHPDHWVQLVCINWQPIGLYVCSTLYNTVENIQYLCSF